MNAAAWLAYALSFCSLMSPLAASAAQARGEGGGLVVFAAASLAEVLQEIGSRYMTMTGTPIRFSFAATSALARQVESGARVDVFFSADQEWMDYLAERQLIDGRSRRDILENRLVLIAPRTSDVNITPNDGAGIIAALQGRRLAIADPDVVPAGKYARAALMDIGIWQRIETQLARAENVRAALMYVARGEVPLGIVYATDARLDPNVRALGSFAVSTSMPITYPVAAIDSTNARAMRFIEFLSSRQSTDILLAAGFGIVTQPD